MNCGLGWLNFSLASLCDLFKAYPTPCAIRPKIDQDNSVYFLTFCGTIMDGNDHGTTVISLSFFKNVHALIISDSISSKESHRCIVTVVPPLKALDYYFGLNKSQGSTSGLYFLTRDTSKGRSKSSKE